MKGASLLDNGNDLLIPWKPTLTPLPEEWVVFVEQLDQLIELFISLPIPFADELLNLYERARILFKVLGKALVEEIRTKPAEPLA